MKDTVNSRILLLKNELGLTTNEFCAKAKISSGTFFNIQHDKNVNQKTINSIAESLGINKNWLLTGKGKKEAEEIIKDEVPWKDAAYNSLKDEIAFYRQVITQLTGGKNVNFLQALNLTGLPKKRSLGAAA